MANPKLKIKLENNINTLTTLLNDYWGNKYFQLYYTHDNKPIILMNKINHSLLPPDIKIHDINDKILSHILHNDYIGSQMLEQINICYNDANNSWNKFVDIMQFASDYNKTYNTSNFRFNKFETYDLLLDDDNNSINKENIILLLKNISYNFQLLGIFILKYYKEIIIKEQRKLDNILKTIKQYFTNINDFYTDDRSINCIYFIIFNLINYKKILIKYHNCDSITKCNKYSLSSSKSVFTDIYKLTSKIFSGKLFSVFFYLINKNTTGKEKWILDKNFIKKHRKFGKQPFEMFPLNTLFEIIYNIHYTSKYIYNQFRSNAIKFKNIIPDSKNKFLTNLKSKFRNYDTLEIGLKNDFGFVKLPSIKNSHIYSDFDLSANYTYAHLDHDTEKYPDFNTNFNTPEHKFKASFGNPQLFKNFGFNLAYRYSVEYEWEASFGNGSIPEFSTVDAQINYTVPSLKSTFKAGANNLLGTEYFTMFGSGNIGSMYYLSWTINN